MKASILLRSRLGRNQQHDMPLSAVDNGETFEHINYLHELRYKWGRETWSSNRMNFTISPMGVAWKEFASMSASVSYYEISLRIFSCQPGIYHKYMVWCQSLSIQSPMHNARRKAVLGVHLIIKLDLKR